MISVQNRRLQLSGSKLFFLLFSISIFTLSCSSTKKTTKRPTSTKSTKPTSNKQNDGKVALETIEWKDITPKSTKDEEDVQTAGTTEKKEAYNITLFIPLKAAGAKDEEILEEGYDQNRFLNYYAGVKMALADLEKEGHALNITVLDSETGAFSSKLESQTKADVIIGPYDRDQLKLTADFGKRKKITVVSPWQSSSSIAKDNAYYLQLRPNIKTYMKSVVDHATANFSEDQIYLLGRDNSGDKSMNGYIQNYVKASKGYNFQEYTIEEDSLLNGETAYDSIFYVPNPTVFIIPNYSFQKDENYIYSCVRKLSSEIGLNKVYLYGMPILIDSKRIEFDHHRNLNMRVARAKYVDRHDLKIKAFRNNYYQNYSALPTDDAYEGYDMMMYVARNLSKHGKGFHFKLSKERSQYLQTGFDVHKVYKSGSDDFKDIQYFENKNVDIIKFNNDKFSRTR